MKVYSEFGSLLRDYGVDVVFGLMGDANMYWLAAFQEAGGRFVAVSHEASAVAMADGYARMTGRVGVATVTHGPGFTNAVTPLVEAARTGSSVLVITGDPPSEPTHMQRLDLAAVCSALGVSSERVHRPESLTRDLNRVFRSLSATGEPLVLNAPLPILLAAAAEQTESARAPLRRSPAGVDPADLDDALGLIISARRPLILAGRGAVHAGAHAEILRLAGILGAPLTTTAMAKEMFRGHEADLGIFGSMSHDVASEAISEADCVIVFGASLNRYTTMTGELVRGKRIVQVDERAAAIGSYVPVDEAVVCDARLAAAAMVEALTEVGHEGSKSWVRRIEARLTAADPFGYQDVSTEATLDIRTAMRELDHRLPSPRSVVSDVGRFVTGAWPHVTVSQPADFTAMSGFGSIGLGLAGAMGAAVARPDRTTVALVGDGGFMMYATELATAVREHLRLVVVVLDDGAYGAEHHKLKAQGIDPKYSLNAWPDFGELAESVGAQSCVVTTVDQLADATPLLAAAEGPVLVDVRISPEQNIAY